MRVSDLLQSPTYHLPEMGTPGTWDIPIDYSSLTYHVTSKVIRPNNILARTMRILAFGEFCNIEFTTSF